MSEIFEFFMKKGKSWLDSGGPDSSIVVSSRIRLARNLSAYPFPEKAALEQKYEILKSVEDACRTVAGFDDAFYVSLEELSDQERKLLWERHLISQEHTFEPQGKGLIVSADEKISMMINEEDHIRLQYLSSGFSLLKSWAIVTALDDELSKRLTFAFLPDLGYLTSCPTNVGTALRASCMLHLPALVLTKRINKVLELLAKLSFTARGLFGEGTQALGNFFQVSNQVTLGLSEEDLIENLSGVINQVKDQEEQARETMVKRYKFTVEDNVWRSLGILKNARIITTREALSHLSMLYLGIDLGIIKGINRDILNNLFIIIQPAHLQYMEHKTLKEETRDYLRASLLRKDLGG